MNEHEFVQTKHCLVFDVVFLQITWHRGHKCARDMNRIYWKFAIIWLTMATFFAIETSFSLKYTINSTNNYFAISETKLDMNATACNLRNIMCACHRSHSISSVYTFDAHWFIPNHWFGKYFNICKLLIWWVPFLFVRSQLNVNVSLNYAQI